MTSPLDESGLPRGAPATDSERSGREVCYRCYKPRAMCVCAMIERIANRTGIFVLQHPRERFHPVGTARLARLGLERVHVETHFTRLEEHAPIARRLPDDIAVLFPREGAPELARLPEGRRPRNLLVIDGTWAQASTLHRANSWIDELPHVRLSPQPSRYRIRKAPKSHYTSTIESILDALRILEPELEGLDRLASVFDAMIDRQVEFADRNPRSKRRVPRDARLSIPEALCEASSGGRRRLILLSSESARDERGCPELFHVGAVRLSPGSASCADVAVEATLSCYVRPERRTPNACRVAAMGGRLEDVLAGMSRTDFAAAWAEFARSEDVIASWRPTTWQSLRDEFACVNEHVLLKSAYCNARKRAGGQLDGILEHEGLEAEVFDAEMPARAKLVLSWLVPIVRRLRADRLDALSRI